jgi:hypothetical protein
MNLAGIRAGSENEPKDQVIVSERRGESLSKALGGMTSSSRSGTRRTPPNSPPRKQFTDDPRSNVRASDQWISDCDSQCVCFDNAESGGDRCRSAVLDTPRFPRPSQIHICRRRKPSVSCCIAGQQSLGCSRRSSPGQDGSPMQESFQELSREFI